MERYLKVRKNEEGTYIETLINRYNIFIDDNNSPIQGRQAVEYAKSLRKEITSLRKFNKQK